MAAGTPTVVTGTWQVSADVFTLAASGSTGTCQWDYTLSATTLTLTGANGEYDFNGDGVPEPAKWNMVLARRASRQVVNGTPAHLEERR